MRRILNTRYPDRFGDGHAWVMLRYNAAGAQYAVEVRLSRYDLKCRPVCAYALWRARRQLREMAGQ